MRTPPRPAPLEGDGLRRSTGPLERVRTLPAAAYTSADVLDWEWATAFEGSWTCVGRAADLAAPGSTMGLRVGREPVLLTRDRAGSLRALSNVCRHRGFELRPCDGTVAEAGVIRCGYHHWTYGLDGAFKGGPELSSSEAGFDRTDPEHGLHPLAAAEWAGWLFVSCAAEPEPLAAHLGNLAELAAPYDCGRLEVAAGHDDVVDANWKLVIENYLECYHCAEIHPQLCRVSPPDGGHHLDATGRWVGGGLVLDAAAETMSLDGRSGGVALPGLDARQRRDVLYVALVPNVLISLHPDYVMTHRLEPLGPGRTRIACRWLFSPEARERPGFDPPTRRTSGTSPTARARWRTRSARSPPSCASRPRATSAGVSARAPPPPASTPTPESHRVGSGPAGAGERRPPAPACPSRRVPTRRWRTAARSSWCPAHAGRGAPRPRPGS